MLAGSQYWIFLYFRHFCAYNCFWVVWIISFKRRSAQIARSVNTRWRVRTVYGKRCIAYIYEPRYIHIYLAWKMWTLSYLWDMWQKIYLGGTSAHMSPIILLLLLLYRPNCHTVCVCVCVFECVFQWLLFSLMTLSIVTDCVGTSTGMGARARETPEEQVAGYNDYVQRYTNCTHVDGNLELFNLKYERTFNLSFLQSIREVSIIDLL